MYKKVRSIVDVLTYREAPYVRSGSTDVNRNFEVVKVPANLIVENAVCDLIL